MSMNDPTQNPITWDTAAGMMENNTGDKTVPMGPTQKNTPIGQAPPPPPDMTTVATPMTPAQKSIQQFNAGGGQPTPGRKAPQLGGKPLGPVNPQDAIDAKKAKEAEDLRKKEAADAVPPVQKFTRSAYMLPGLLTLLAILIGLIWLLIPTKSGYTRAQLLWFTFIGKTKLTTDQPTTTAADIAAAQTAVNQILPPNTTPGANNSSAATLPTNVQVDLTSSISDIAALDLLSGNY